MANASSGVSTASTPSTWKQSSAPRSDPASDGATATEIVRSAGLALSGTVTVAVASPLPTIDPLADASRRSPYGNTGTGNSMASVSASVLAVAVTDAGPTLCAANRQSSRRSPPLSIGAVDAAGHARGGASPEAGGGLRGLADRVDAVGGRLRVHSPPGGGTVVEAQLFSNL